MLCDEKMRRDILSRLHGYRYEHSLGVERCAIALAKKYGGDPALAGAAGILHDITKHLSPQEQLNLCEKYGIIPCTVEKKRAENAARKNGRSDRTQRISHAGRGMRRHRLPHDRQGEDDHSGQNSLSGGLHRGDTRFSRRRKGAGSWPRPAWTVRCSTVMTKR